jgi:hypothetical protein
MKFSGPPENTRITATVAKARKMPDKMPSTVATRLRIRAIKYRYKGKPCQGKVFALALAGTRRLLMCVLAPTFKGELKRGFGASG